MDIKKIFLHVTKTLDSIIAPPFCRECKLFLAYDQVFCNDCRLLIKPIISKPLQITSTYSIPVFAIGAYEEPLIQLIKAKNSGNPTSSRQLGYLMYDLTHIKNMPCDIIVPVPLHWMREMWRGFNQSALMAQELASLLNKPVISALKRNHKTLFQRDLSAFERHLNIKDAFSLSSKQMVSQITNRHIILIDDVLTTGSTLRETARILYTYKPASIIAVVAARVIE